jgi:hypothetical protein
MMFPTASSIYHPFHQRLYLSLMSWTARFSKPNIAVDPQEQHGSEMLAAWLYFETVLRATLI